MKQHKHYSSAFTIVELLIVIVVIGILAAIIIVTYGGIQRQAGGAVLKSDLSNSVGQLGIDSTANGTFPASAAAANGGQGLKASPGTTYQYTYNSGDNSYCLSATSSRSGVPAYHVDSTNGGVQDGVCSGDIPPGSTLVANQGIVTTLAGSGVQGFANGTGTDAQFQWSYGLAVDSSKNVYVADGSNYRIRKITSSGVVSTFAGSGTEGTANGTGTGAQFSYTEGVAVDTSGTVYVADSSNNLIRKITSAGVVTTLAGSTQGSADGTGAGAQFYEPSDIVVDASGNLYVTDAENHRIRKVTQAGVVTTFAGSGAIGSADGTGTSAQFVYPESIAIDSTGNLFVADMFGNTIRKITTVGVVTTFAGSGVAGFADGTGTNAQFYSPAGIAIDSANNMYVADKSNNRIRKITPAGVVTTIAGSGVAGFADGTGTNAQFMTPTGIDVDSTGTLYVADAQNYRIRMIK